MPGPNILPRTAACGNPMTEQVILALSTCPDDGTARQIAEALVTEGLAACVNRIPGVRSSYVWKSELQDDAEVLLIIKTTATRVPEVEARLKALHPYELPEWVVLPVAGGNEAYLQWVRQGVATKDGK